jgi:hypothetical protein
MLRALQPRQPPPRASPQPCKVGGPQLLEVFGLWGGGVLSHGASHYAHYLNGNNLIILSLLFFYHYYYEGYCCPNV